MGDLEKQKGTSSTILKAMCVFVFFVALREFKLELSSGNAQIGAKSPNFSPMWPSNLMDDLTKTIEHLFHAPSSYVCHFIAKCEFKLELSSRNTQIWTKLLIFFANMTFKFHRKNIVHLFYATSNFLDHFIVICEFKLDLRSRNSQNVEKNKFWPVTLTLNFCMDIILSIVIIPENFIMIVWWKHCEQEQSVTA